MEETGQKFVLPPPIPSAALISCDDETLPQSELEKVEQVMSSLPKGDNPWKYDHKPLHLYQGFWYIPHFLEGTILAQHFFRPQPGDILVCSAPKSGTTWLMALTCSIATRHRFPLDSHPLLTKGPHDCVPSFVGFGRKPTLRSPGLPLISTHTPYNSLPQSALDSDYVKIIYICREPKDAFVSMFHFAAKRRPAELGSVSIKEAFDLFCQGNSLFGPFWDHILGFWKASKERPDKVLFLKYEDVMADTCGNVRKMADFMGYPFSAEEEEDGAVENISELCSFDNLRNLEVNKIGLRHQHDPLAKNSTFFRKAKTGDWKNHLTAEMAARLDQIMEEKFSPVGLKFDAAT